MECSRRISLRYSNLRFFGCESEDASEPLRALTCARETAGVGDESVIGCGMGCRYSLPLPWCCVQVGGRKWQLAIS